MSHWSRIVFYFDTDSKVWSMKHIHPEGLTLLQGTGYKSVMFREDLKENENIRQCLMSIRG